MEEKTNPQSYIEPISLYPNHEKTIAVSEVMKKIQIKDGSFSIGTFVTDYDKDLVWEKVCISFVMPVSKNEDGKCFSQLINEEFMRLVMSKDKALTERIYKEMQDTEKPAEETQQEKLDRLAERLNGGKKKKKSKK